MRKHSDQTSCADIKEKIIGATTELIGTSHGDPNRVSIRAIAHQAGVSIGLINYHFMSKEKLIEVCVERIIKQVIHSFKFDREIQDDPKDRLFSGTVSVFTFLKENPEIAKISIVSDLSSPHRNANSVTSYQAILSTLPDGFSGERKKVAAFMLLSTIQSAFLIRSVADDLLDFDLYTDEGVRSFFKHVIDLLFTPESTHD